jgi:oxygen-independent coproporphyrinogen-3 oxidase
VRETGLGFATDEALSPLEAAEERLILGLRIEDGASFAEVAPLGLSANAPKVRELVELDLVADDPHRLRATRRGRQLLDRVTATLAGV